jgi:hypothetical protein
MTARSLPKVIALVSLLVAVCCAGTEVADTPESRSKAAAALARLEIESGGLDKVLDDGADWGLSYSTESLELELGRQLTPEESESVREIIRASLAEILTAERWEQVLTGVYSESFTAQELDDIRTFFESPAGGKVLRTESSLADQVGAAGDVVFEEHLDEFVARVDEGLAEEFGELAGGETP